MSESQKVTQSDIRRVAELANLELSSAEEQSLLRDLNSILDHVAQLNELDTSSIQPMAQVSDILTVSAGPSSWLREDTVAPSLDHKMVMDSAPDSDGVFFLVPKVIER